MDVKKVARLANLPLTSGEEKKFGQQLEKVLEYVGQLKKVDTSGIVETNQVTGLVNVSRTDRVSLCTPLIHGYVKVKAIFSNE